MNSIFVMQVFDNLLNVLLILASIACIFGVQQLCFALLYSPKVNGRRRIGAFVKARTNQQTHIRNIKSASGFEFHFKSHIVIARSSNANRFDEFASRENGERADRDLQRYEFSMPVAHWRKMTR